ncbi:MAG: transketolase family protein [Candidatus Pacebacteria bacterium]|nr:transketolase family protein [Candidatus Paceibacterota bacterium]
MFASHLQPNLTSGEVEKVPNRMGYGDGLLEAGKRDERIVALCCDLTESTQTHKFAEAFPRRFVQMGIAEQNMISVASGMAAMGKIPFTASYAMFSPGRSWEQVRTCLCYNDSNVKVVGAHAGVSVGPDGATHQAIEDIAIMRVLPNMVVIAPADVHEARKVTLAAAKYDGPVYFRLGRSATPVVTTPESPFEIGKAQRLYSRDDAHEKKVGIVVTGTLLYNALMAAKELNENGIGASVLHMATIKPLDTEALEAFAAEHGVLVTVEEHQIIGGLGGAVAEHLGEVRPTKIVRVGMQDRFGVTGEPDELIVHFGMDVPSIVAAARRVIA